ncbi:NUT family member 2G-like [Rhinolophus ferrumequinum]|uniref:NUT family member 2G-like n=1 Tax=Rhinolophus ferrumequinum TaxID=59479 RepID=UPI00140FC501|nr:NUT family member 2G-like [Rhinolophus ferrumequinum]
MGKWGEVVLAGDLSSGAACGPVYSEMSSPRARLEASAVLRPAVIMSPGASMSPFVVLPFPPPTAGPAYWPSGEQHLPPLVTPSFPPGQPGVLPAFPGTPSVAGDAGHGPTGTGAGNIIVQVRSEVGQAEPPQTQTLVLTQAPLNCSAPGALCGGAVCPAPQFLTASAVQTIMLAPAVGGTQAVQGSWSPGLPPQAPPPAAQLASIVSPVSAGPWPNGAPREGGLATSRSKAASDNSGNPKSVYENFRCWQRFKALAWSLLPQSSDPEALSCFLIPVLRSLSRLNPTMTLEDGLKRAMREWQHTSNFDRMIFYEMAEKFMEFEEEEMQIQKLQWMKAEQGLPPPAPPRPDPWEPPAPLVGSQPGCNVKSAEKRVAWDAPQTCVPRTAIPRAHPAGPQPHSSQRPRETEAPEEIPPEAVREYMDIMDELLGSAHSATGVPGGEWEEDLKEPQQDDDGTYPAPGLLSYIDELCSQEDFDTKVEAVIHPRFLEQLLSSEPQLDPVALAEELKQEEALTPAQVSQETDGPLMALTAEESEQAPQSRREPRLDSPPSVSEASEDARRHDYGPQLGVSDIACSPEADFKDPQRQCRADAHLSRPKVFDVSSGCQESPALRARWPPSPPEGPRHPASRQGPRDAFFPRETCPVRETHRPADWCGVDEEVLPSLSFLLDSQNSLLPWRFPQSPVSASGLVFPGGRGDRGAPQSLSYQRLGLSRVDPSAAKSRKRALDGDPAPAEKTPRLGTDLRVSVRPALALGPVRSSQPQKRKWDPFVMGKRRKLHCSQ